MAWLFETDSVENWAWLDNVFTPEECEKIKQLALQKEKKQARTGGGFLPQGNLNKEIRKSEIIWIHSNDEESHWIFDKLARAVTYINNEYFKFELQGFCESLQFTEYKAPDEHYSEHVDKSYKRPIRKLSIVIQLTNESEYEGGELHLIFGKDPNIMKKTQGSRSEEHTSELQSH